MRCPAAGRRTLPLSMIAKTPKLTVTIPIKRALVPKSEIVIASSHGMANTKSQREANASLPRQENSLDPKEERTHLPLSEWSSVADSRKQPNYSMAVNMTKLASQKNETIELV